MSAPIPLPRDGVLVPLLALPPAIQHAVDLILLGQTVYPPGVGDGDYRGPQLLPFLPDARDFLPYAEAALQPATLGAVGDWVTRLRGGVRIHLDDRAFAARWSAILDACDGMPAGVWAPATRREALQRFDFFPSAAQIYDLLRPHARRIALTVRALHVLTTPPGPHRRPGREG